MTNLTETETWEEGVYQIELTDPVVGGADGISNRQAKQLANRTSWLKAKVDALVNGTISAFKASKLATARTLSISGAGTGSVAFDGSANVDIPLTLANNGAVAGTYPKVTINAKGLVTSGAALVAADIPALDWAKITSGKPTTLGGYGITDAAPRGSITHLSASANITPAQLGVLLLDAGAGARTFTLPSSNAALGVIECVLWRVDATTNALVIAATGTEKLMLDTTAQAAGQSTTELLFSGDYLRLRSDGDGKWWCVGQAQLPGSIASGLVVFSTAGSSSFTVPPVLRSGRRRAKVKVTGAGGGAGRWGGGGGGGGGGGVAEKLCDLTGVSSVACTVGTGGLGRTASDGAGTVGGSSSFGAYCSATGGSPGVNYVGGQTGSGVGGDTNYGLGSAGSGVRVFTVSTLYTGGQGGGPGPAPSGSGTSGSPGVNATLPGGGGSGGTSDGNGGNGAPGEIKVEW